LFAGHGAGTLVTYVSLFRAPPGVRERDAEGSAFAVFYFFAAVVADQDCFTGHEILRSVVVYHLG
jgi:hypothetical protein